MRRVISNYPDDEFKQLADKAKAIGFTISAYQRYCVRCDLGERDNTLPIKELVEKMFQELEKRGKGDPFVVSALLKEEWPSLSRSEKMTMAKQLAAKIRSDSRFVVASAKKGKTTTYTRIK